MLQLMLQMLGKYNDKGQRLLSFKNVNGCSIKFQYSKNCKTTADIIPGIPSGIPIFTKITNSLAPSILADSIIEFGILQKNLYIINTEKVENIAGNIILP